MRIQELPVEVPIVREDGKVLGFLKVIEVARDDLDERGARDFVSLLRQLARAKQIVGFLFFGWDDDPREACEIPEIQQWLALVIKNGHVMVDIEMLYEVLPWLAVDDLDGPNWACPIWGRFHLVHVALDAVEVVGPPGPMRSIWTNKEVTAIWRELVVEAMRLMENPVETPPFGGTFGMGGSSRVRS